MSKNLSAYGVGERDEKDYKYLLWEEKGEVQYSLITSDVQEINLINDLIARGVAATSIFYFDNINNSRQWWRMAYPKYKADDFLNWYAIDSASTDKIVPHSLLLFGLLLGE